LPSVSPFPLTPAVVASQASASITVPSFPLPVFISQAFPSMDIPHLPIKPLPSPFSFSLDH
jgi:hypothetical protein